MNTAFEIFFAVLLACIPLSVFYWHVFRPIVLTRLKYRIYAARDELRLLVIRKEIPAGEKAFPILDVHCNNCIGVLHEVGFIRMLRQKSDPEVKLRVEKELATVDGAGHELRKIKRNLHEALVGALVINSPFFAFFSLLMVLVLLFPYFWFNQTKQLVNEFWRDCWGLSYTTAQA